MDSDPKLWGVTDQVKSFILRHQWLMGIPDLRERTFRINGPDESSENCEPLPNLSMDSLAKTAAQWAKPHLMGIRCVGMLPTSPVTPPAALLSSIPIPLDFPLSVPLDFPLSVSTPLPPVRSLSELTVKTVEADLTAMIQGSLGTAAANGRYEAFTQAYPLSVQLAEGRGHVDVK